jgi:threonine/homoserine/homoserine lactone efflux protein
MSKGVTQGLRNAIFTALGSLTAITAILSLSFTGLGVIIASSELVFSIIKWCGAAYLIYLGWQAFRSPLHDYSDSTQPQVQKNQAGNHFWSGFIVGASNPKAIVFFTALFPQFIDPNLSLWHQYTVFASTFALFELSWLAFYGYLGSRSSKWLMAPGRARVFNRLSGSVFMGAGVLLSFSSRAHS